MEAVVAERKRFRLNQLVVDHRGQGQMWDPGEYAGEYIDDAPPRVTRRVRLYRGDGAEPTIEVPGSFVSEIQ